MSKKMYKVKYKNGKEQLIPNTKGSRITLLQKQGMLSARQKVWLSGVESIERLRTENDIDHRTLMMTKDISCSCKLCTGK